MALILLSSPSPRMGKDMFADYLVEVYGYKKFALADPIKEIAHKYYDIDELPKEQRREYYIHIGEQMRELDIGVWCKALDCLAEHTGFKNVVISDCRMNHEFEFFKKYKNVITIGIESDCRGDKRLNNDPTQRDYPNIKKDYVIENNSSIKDFYREIDLIMKEIK